MLGICVEVKTKKAKRGKSGDGKASSFRWTVVVGWFFNFCYSFVHLMFQMFS